MVVSIINVRTLREPKKFSHALQLTLVLNTMNIGHTRVSMDWKYINQAYRVDKKPCKHGKSQPPHKE